MEASEATVQDGTYTIQRPFVFVTKKGETLSDAAQAFIDFATSGAADNLIAQAGAVPLCEIRKELNNEPEAGQRAGFRRSWKGAHKTYGKRKTQGVKAVPLPPGAG